MFAMGLIGGICGIFGGIFAVMFGGIAGAFGSEGASQISSLGFVAILASVVGIVGASISKTKPKVAGWMMIGSGVVGVISISAFYMVSVILFVVAGIIGLRTKPILTAQPTIQDELIGSEGTIVTMKKPIYKIWWFWVLIVVGIMMISAISGGEESTNNPSSSVEPQETQKEDVSSNTSEQTYQLNEEAVATKLSFIVSEVKKDTKIGTNEYLQKMTENEYVIIKLSVTNNDVEARTIDDSMFKLKDSNGKEYTTMSGADLYVNEDVSFFLTRVNPGLKLTGYIVFETPKDLTGLILECDSGMLFKAGETVKIDLGM
jgi:hypothetical protein